MEDKAVVLTTRVLLVSNILMQVLNNTMLLFSTAFEVEFTVAVMILNLVLIIVTTVWLVFMLVLTIRAAILILVDLTEKVFYILVSILDLVMLVGEINFLELKRSIAILLH